MFLLQGFCYKFQYIYHIKRDFGKLKYMKCNFFYFLIKYFIDLGYLIRSVLMLIIYSIKILKFTKQQTKFLSLV